MACKEKNNCDCSNMNGFGLDRKNETLSKKFERKRILIICTGNSCRSQMAEAWLRSFDDRLDVFSAGIHPEKEVSPFAIEVMKAVNIDIRQQYPKPVGDFMNDDFDVVITVCDNAKKACPVFTANVKHLLHIGFEDPADAIGTSDEILMVYQKVSIQIRDAFYKLFIEELSK
ncbi:MAG: arsenate reductase ArsC [Bacteroidota bacterium]